MRNLALLVKKVLRAVRLERRDTFSTPPGI